MKWSGVTHVRHRGSRLPARFVMGTAALGLTLGLLASPVLAQSSPGSNTTSTTIAAKRSGCTAVRQRLAEAPPILTRIDAHLDRLRAQLDNARLPARRASLATRIERLEALRTALAEKIAEARRKCATV